MIPPGQPDSPLIEVTAITHRGAARKHNQDALVIGALTVAEADLVDPARVTLVLREPVVVAVADGLGGHAAGEAAAALAARQLAGGGKLLTGPETVARLLEDVNGELYRVAAAQPACAGMGATIAGLVFQPDSVLWFNVGDARLYREDGGYLGQVSIDDSPGRSDAYTGPGSALSSAVVVQCLGGAATPTPIDPHIGTEPGGDAGRWLLCSDGLSDLVPASAMERILADAGDDVLAVRRLWAAAMDASGRDNISIVLVRPMPPAPAGA